MHHHAIAGFLAAISAAHAVVAIYCFASPIRSSERREFLVFGFLNLASMVTSAGYVQSQVSGAPNATGILVAEMGRAAACALLVHYVSLYARKPLGHRALALIYGSATAFIALAMLGLVVRLEAGHVEAVTILGLKLETVVFPTTAAATALALLRGFAAGLAVFWIGQGFLEGRREGLTFVGATLLAVTVSYDALRSLGLAFGPPLGPHGFAMFDACVLMTLLTRYSSLRRELEGRAAELKERSRELATSYDRLRTAQDELVRKQQLAAVGELSAVVAHEVRNPLAIISNAVATLRRKTVSPEDRETLLGILDEESSRLNRLVGDLLRYARPVNLERQPVNVRDILNRGIALVEGKEDLTVELDIAANVEKIYADQSLLRQVVDNLINNAVQAMSGGGTLTVTAEPAELDRIAGVEIIIRDTGEGMDTQVRNRALDPFFTTRPAGTGLGLAIVARIIDAHGGQLRIQSAAGAGTVVRVFLPRDEEPATTQRPPLVERAERTSVPTLPVEVRKAMGAR